jgi:hypothetical protein
MSIEYRASAKIPAAKVAAFLMAMEKEKIWQVVSRGERDLLLRWTGHPADKDASEDVRIDVEPESVYVAVRVGTQQQREDLLRKLGELLLAQGFVADFEEL